MNLYTGYIHNKLLIHYYSEEQNYYRMPTVWVKEDKKKFYLCGAYVFLDHYVPNRIGYKNATKAFSILLHLQTTLEKLTLKEKKKLCLLNLQGQEYQLNTIHLTTQSFRNMSQFKINLKKKVLKNEKGEK